jgi:DNA helicase-2/ATP-dependent DNA helicase PcrA
VVGDDLQAIYGFRAASTAHILEFADAFPDAASITLECNYRSTQPVLDVANAVAAHADRAHPKRLRSARGNGARPSLVLCRDEADEAFRVAEAVLVEHERGVALRDQAVLMRAAHHSDLLELELGRRRVPYVKYGGIRYLEAAHVKDFLALLRLVVNPADQVSWFRLLQLLEGVGPRFARRILDGLDLHEEEALGTQWRALPEVPEAARADGAALVDALTRARGLDAPGDQASVLGAALEPLVRRRYADAEPRLHDLSLLAARAEGAATLEQFAAELVLDPPQSSAVAGPPLLDEDYLVLSTIHSAKGLEWDVVSVIHASDGNLPSDMALSSREGLDEERRLLYVALTRARRSLHVYVPVQFFHHPSGSDDAHGLGKLSRFLDDDVQALCEVVRPHDSEPVLAGAEIHERVLVSVDELWQ